MSDQLPQPQSPATSPPARDDFYVGYLPTPPGHRATLRLVVPALLLSIAGAAVLIASIQRDPGPAVWRSEAEQFAGTLLADPVPMLVALGEDGSPRVILLVEEGKHGAHARIAARLSGAQSAQATIHGRVLARDARMVVELSPGEDAIALTGQAAGQSGNQPPISPAATLPAQPLGPITLRGEIIDSKCFHGAMKPGDGKSHKACATLCIRNGIPAMLATPEASGNLTLRLLVVTGGIDADTLSKIGEPVEVSGELSTLAGLEVITIQPASVRRAGR
jgi:hypothetical protein